MELSEMGSIHRFITEDAIDTEELGGAETVVVFRT
jgi:hypothetical protein